MDREKTIKIKSSDNQVVELSNTAALNSGKI